MAGKQRKVLEVSHVGKVTLGRLGARKIDPTPILWMDEILHHLRNPEMMILLYMPRNNGFPWYEGGAGFCPSTVSQGCVLLKREPLNSFPLSPCIPTFGPVGTCGFSIPREYLGMAGFMAPL